MMDITGKQWKLIATWRSLSMKANARAAITQSKTLRAAHTATEYTYERAACDLEQLLTAAETEKNND